MSSHDYLVFLLQLLVLLASSRLLGEAFRRLHQPAVVGELLAGVLLGPSLLGSLAPETYSWLFPTPEGRLLPPALDAFTLLGVTLLMLAAGLEVDLSLCLKERKLTALCAVFGTAVPLAVGVAAGWVFAPEWGAPAGVSRWAFALLLGINLAMSALPVIAKTLLDLGIYRTRVGQVILSAAMLDDLGVWLLFSVAMSLTGGPAGESASPARTALLMLAFLGLVVTLGRAVARRALPYLESRLPWPGGVVTFTVVLGLSFACIALWIGVHPVFGSLLAGVAIGTSHSLRPGTKDVVYEFVMSVFAPIFFASIGLRMDFAAHFDPGIVSWVFLLGCLGKVLGAGFGARLGGLSRRESAAVAAGLNSRGIMGIVLGVVALEHGIIDRRMFVALAVLGVATSLISGPLLRLSLGRVAAGARSGPNR
ncbi:MAG: cation:proton antiporter [Planctomycetes bacterium]|nr:cation:proton antiporter [Planctomycetota bacterium]